MTIPTEHRVDAQKLQADGLVDLFRIELKPTGVLYLKADNTATWQGNTYEGTGLKLTGVGNSSDDERSRPQFAIANPEGIFSALVGIGSLDNADVIRIQVLYDDLINNRNISRVQRWSVSRVVSLNHRLITLELRNSLDSQYFVLPGRMFTPPEFPAVSLG